MEEVLKFLQEAGVWYLATDEDGQPHVRPFGSQMIWNGKLYFQTGLKKDVAKQLLKNPKIEISAMNKKGEWIRLKAEAIHDPSIEAQKAMLDTMPELKKMYAAGDGNTAVFYLRNAAATICSFTTEPKTITF
ncbi:MAG: pyridoxamine 5'-phosphate oxidase family protein [Lachnospiraceae bacterium]|nr:pyridoxamine 5'-phosphate oxidase family protein [Lachnospiraceae bacterium]